VASEKNLPSHKTGAGAHIVEPGSDPPPLPHHHHHRGAAPPTIVVDSVRKVFGRRSPVVAVDGVSFNVPAGEFVSLLGPSGCGKSTLLRLMSGLDTVTEGTITVNGMSPQEARRQRQFGVVFQTPVLFDWRKVKDNIALPLELMGYPRAEIKERTRDLLELVGLFDFRDSRPYQLSGGMQQRVAIARALTFRPRYLMMDEPLGALDAMTRDRMATELLRIWSDSPGTTVVFITHSIPEAVLLSDRIVILSAHPGRVLQTMDIDLPRPRTEEIRESEEFARVENEIRHLLFSEARAGWEP
jgi:NitT/TauT family transport system ATP-binding protein